MSKQELKTKATNLVSSNANGQQVEQTLTVEDSFLPPPAELKEYLAINPEIVKLLIEASRNEQQHRHMMDRQKMKVIGRDGLSVHRINIVGMAFAFLIMMTGLALSAYLIYKDKDVTGTVFAGITIVMAVNTFLKHVKKK
jgi:uncharacterized membrane protein